VGGDRFSARVKQDLAHRAGHQCSRPDCRALTVGPTTSGGYTNVGVAAHITAASPGGPRYDPGMSSEERSSATNGIWLCQNHAKEVDDDPSQYSVTALREWKRLAEEDARARLGHPLDRFTLDVALEVMLHRDAGDGLLVAGKTNLPDGTRLIVSVGPAASPNRYGQSKTTVSGGMLVCGPFTQGGEPHTQAWFRVRLISHFSQPWQQPKPVLDVVGRDGMKLAGRFVQDLHPELSGSERIVDAAFEVVAPPLGEQPRPAAADVARAIALVQAAVLAVDGSVSAEPVVEVVRVFMEYPGLREREGWSGRPLPDATVLVKYSYWNGTEPAEAHWRVALPTGEVRYENKLGKFLSWLAAD
jgi:hypothetical protein